MNDPAASNDPQSRVRVNPIVFYGSGIAIVALAVWAIIDPQGANDTIGVGVGWISEWFGWFYILVATVFLAFVIFLALSRFGNIKLGPDDSVPDFSLFSWAAMLFAAGIGTDLMFFSVAEPVTQYLAPPVGDGQTIEAARQATIWMLFHYGTTGWGMYALMGVALAYFAYRRDLPLSVRSTLYPLFGRRIYGPLGHTVDLAAVLGTIFGIATSLGIGVVQLNFGLKLLFGIPVGLAAQIGLVVVAVVAATISSVTGVERGIRRLSELNVILAIALAAFILITGETVFLLNAFVLNINDYISRFMSMTLQTFAFDRPTEWLNSWTLFFWAWWVAWASFVGLFLARISRGRTIRQFIAGTLIIPFLYILMWTSIFGNSAIALIRDGHEQFGQLAMNHPEKGFYTLLQYFPAFPVVAFVATFVGLLFYITSADSGALVMGNLTSYREKPHDDASKPVRIFWAMATGLLTLAMLIVGGVPALQNATIIMGLPFALVMILLMFGLYRALRLETLTDLGRRQSWPALLSARTGAQSSDESNRPDWRARLARTLETPDRDAVSRFLSNHVTAALSAVRDDMREHDLDCQVTDDSVNASNPTVELSAHRESHEPFIYRVVVQASECADPRRPGYSGATYHRLGVELRDGGQGYDIMGYSRDQLIHDVLDQYEKYAECLRIRLKPG